VLTSSTQENENLEIPSFNLQTKKDRASEGIGGDRRKKRTRKLVSAKTNGKKRGTSLKTSSFKTLTIRKPSRMHYHRGCRKIWEDSLAGKERPRTIALDDREGQTGEKVSQDDNFQKKKKTEENPCGSKRIRFLRKKKRGERRRGETLPTKKGKLTRAGKPDLQPSGSKGAVSANRKESISLLRGPMERTLFSMNIRASSYHAERRKAASPGKAAGPFCAGRPPPHNAKRFEARRENTIACRFKRSSARALDNDAKSGISLKRASYAARFGGGRSRIREHRRRRASPARREERARERGRRGRRALLFGSARESVCGTASQEGPMT